MNKLVKLSTAVGAAGVSLAFFATTAAFADTTATNTGNHVTINSNTTNSSTVSVSNSNSAMINQSTNSSSNTGGNDANRNVGSASVSTGNAAVSNSLGVNANTNKTSVSNVGNTTNPDVKLVNTGNDFDANANNTNATTVNVSNNNLLGVSQWSNSDANTGDNSANRNASVDGDPSITTGDAGISNVFNATGNNNQTTLSNIGAGMGMGNDVKLVNTGNHANLNANNTNSLVLGVENCNVAMIMQSAHSSSNTGDNRANRNVAVTGGSSITTGDAGISNVFGVHANSNTTSINGLGLAGSGSEALDVTNTGNHLDVNGNTTVATTVIVSNDNTITVEQETCDDANTGDNQANRNANVDGNTGIFSGNAAMAAALMATANANWTSIM
jgi:hypothetical protein